MGAAWMTLALAGFHLTRGKDDPGLSGAWAWASRAPSAVEAEGGETVSAGASAIVRPSPPKAVAPPPAPPRVVSGLSPVQRQAPDIHQGSLGFVSHLDERFARDASDTSSERTAREPVSTIDMAPLVAAPSLAAAVSAYRASSREPLTYEPAARESRALSPERDLVPERDSAPSEPEPAPDPKLASSLRVWTQTAGMSCERAYEGYSESIDVTKVQGPDVPREAFAERLENFSHYSRCDLDHQRDISICVAVQGGKAKGVTIKTQPADARLAACIAEAVSHMRFPSSEHMDLVRSELTIR